MKSLGYYNGIIDELSKMCIPMNDRGCYFGDGVYDATYTSNYKLYAIDCHLDRFFANAALIDIELHISKQQLKELIINLTKKLDSDELFVYWQVTRGTEGRNHAYGDELRPNLWITITPKKVKDVTKPMQAITLEDTRYFHCNIKTLNLLPNIMAAKKAQSMGCEEAIFHRNGRITEGASTNVSILKDGVFKTAPLDNLILPGVTRAKAIKICKRLDILVVESAFDIAEMMSADEIMISSAGKFMIGLSHIDGKAVGGGDKMRLKSIQEEFLKEFYGV